MKKKVIFAVGTGLFALAMVFNMNILQSNSAGDVSLESITVMAQAQSEFNPCPGGVNWACKWDGWSCGMIYGCASYCSSC